MSTNVWSYREALSENIILHLEGLTEHLRFSEHNQLIKEIELHLGNCIQIEKDQSNIKHTQEKKQKIKSVLDKTHQLNTEITDILSEQGAEEVKMYLLENDEDKWLKLKVLELDLPNHLDSLAEIAKYLDMLIAIKDRIEQKKTEQINAPEIFLSQLKTILKKYKIPDESTAQTLYHLIMEEVGINQADT